MYEEARIKAIKSGCVKMEELKKRFTATKRRADILKRRLVQKREVSNGIVQQP